MDSVLDIDLNHIYATQGDYTITASGTIEGFQNNTNSWRWFAPISTTNLLLSVVDMWDVGWKNLKWSICSKW